MTDTRARVLIVDDDPAITRIYNEVLVTEGFDVPTAGSCAEAMAQMDAAKGNVDVLVVDLGLPDCDGAEFVRNAAAKYGARPTMFVTGWTDEFWQLQDSPGRWIIMRKPVPIKKLLAAVRWLAKGGDKPQELNE